jgi:predicted nucleic acid-binding Zn ribbon protein
MADGPDRIGELLGGLFRKWGLQGELERQSALEQWDEIVGEGIARVTRPQGVARGVLYVEVRSSAWITELNLMRHDLLARLNAGRSEGRIERIVFRLAEEPDDI